MISTADSSSTSASNPKILKRNSKSFTLLSSLAVQQHSKPSLKDYTLQTHLQNGASSTVFSAIHISTNSYCTIKCIYKDRIPVASWKRDKKSKKTLPTELFFITRLQHQNIIRYRTQFEDDTFIYLVMDAPSKPVPPSTDDLSLQSTLQFEKEFIPMSPQSISSVKREVLKSRDAYRILCDQTIDGFTFNAYYHSNQELKAVFTQIVKGVAYMHSNLIMHNDLKLENFIIEPGNQVKLIDFGSASYIKEEKTLMQSAFYSAPQRIKGTRRDVYSLGVILHQLVYKNYPSSCFLIKNGVFDGLIWKMLNAEFFECLNVLDALRLIVQ